MTTQQTTSKVDTIQGIIRNLGFDFRSNLVTRRIEVFGKANEVLGDELLQHIRAEVCRITRVDAEFLIMCISDMAYAHRYHPIQQYLTALSYDGKDHFRDLVSCFSNSDGLLKIWLRKWMLGAVAKAATCGNTQNYFLILDGPQGIGKSKFVQWLGSPMSAYYLESRLNPDSNQSLENLASRWIWEVSEVGASLRKADLEAFKAFVTQSTVTIRQPYAKYDLTRPAMASMIGTVNNRGGGIFDDPTGSRRFLICQIEAIDWKEYLKLDIDQVWAEIYAAYLAGEPIELTDDERLLQFSKNADYQPADSLEDFLRIGFKIDQQMINNNAWHTPTAEIIKYLQEDAKYKIGTTSQLSRSLAETCRRLGLVGPVSIRPLSAGTLGSVARGYKGIQKI